MKKFIRSIFALIFFFPCIAAFSQQTVIHDIPWESDTVGMWGSGSTVWSINQIDTLVDFTIGPYGNTYSYVYHPPLLDSVGMIFDYGAFVDMQVVFEMVGWSGGAVKVNYPTKIKMDFPPNGSFSNGSWVTIPSEYREQDTVVHPTDYDNWDIYAKWPTAGKIELFTNLDMQANVDLIFSNFTDPLNITWDTMHIIQPINVNLDTFDIFLIDLIHGKYVIPWVAYHTDPFTGNTVIDSVYLIHDAPGWPLQFPPIFYDLIGISGDISIPDITNYTKWIENEQRLKTWGNDEYLHLNLDIIKFVQVMCHYLSNIPSLEELETVSQAFQYEEGDTSIVLYNDPLTGEDFSINITWDLIDANLLFTNTMNQTLTFEDNKEYSFFGIPIPPKHYPNVWNVFGFPVSVDYEVLDTLGAVIESGNANSVKFGSDYDLRLRFPCYDYDSLPITITHTIDPWLTNFVRDSIDVDFYIKVLDIAFSIGTPSNPVYSYSYILYEDTLSLGTFEGPPLYGPPIFMPWLIDGYFVDTTFVPNIYLVPSNHPLTDSVTFTNVLCFGTNTGSATVIAHDGTPPYTYQWSDTSMISTNATIFNLGVGTYFVTVTDANGCMVKDSVTLTNMNPPINISHTSVNVLCHGDNTGSAALTVTGGTPAYQYTWSPNVGTGPSITNLYAGTYYVTVQDNVGCTVLDTIAITEPDSALQITVMNVTNVTCNNGNNGSIDISVAGGTSPYTYHWSNGFTTQNLNNLIAGNYIITVTDANNCKEYDTISITQPNQIFAHTHNYKMCLGQTISIGVDSTTGGTPPYTYMWNTGVTTSNINITPVVTSSYAVYAIDANGCPGVASIILVDVTNALTINLTADDDSICIGSSAQIFANINGGGGPPYIVTLNTGQSGTSPLTVTPNITTTYIATVWDTCHYASVQDTIVIHVFPLPTVNFSADPTSGCQPLTVQFTDLNMEPNCTYSWDFGNGTSGITSPNPSYTYSHNGTYTVMLNITSQYGCKNSMAINNMIDVWEKPSAAFVSNPSTTSVLDPLVFFNNTSSSTYNSYWNFGDGSTSFATDPTHHFPAADTFNVMLVITSIHGCLDTAWEQIQVKDIYTLYIPNAFTPDDDGINDVFLPKGNLIDPDNYEMMIFDRWGGMIFETKDLYKGWDGTVNGNPIQADGVFNYVIIYKDNFGRDQKKIGSVTLLYTSGY